MNTKNLWEKEPYLTPECVIVSTRLSVVLCQSGGGSGGGWGNGGEDEPAFLDFEELETGIVDIL